MRTGLKSPRLPAGHTRMTWLSQQHHTIQDVFVWWATATVTATKVKKEWPSNCSVFLEKDPGLFRHTAASYFIAEKLQHSKAVYLLVE